MVSLKINLLNGVSIRLRGTTTLQWCSYCSPLQVLSVHPMPLSVKCRTYGLILISLQQQDFQLQKFRVLQDLTIF